MPCLLFFSLLGCAKHRAWNKHPNKMKNNLPSEMTLKCAISESSMSVVSGEISASVCRGAVGPLGGPVPEISKLRATHYELRDFSPSISYFWLEQLRKQSICKQKFTKHIMGVAESRDKGEGRERALVT